MPHIRALTSSVRTRACIENALHQAFSLSVLGRFGDILKLLLPYQGMVEALHDAVLTGPYHFRLALNYAYLNNHERVAQHARTAIDAAQQCEDRTTLGKAHYALALNAYWSSAFSQGVKHGQQAVTLLQEMGDELDWLALAEFVLGLHYTALGDFELALAAAAHVLAIAHNMDDPRLQSFASYTMGWLYAVQGNDDKGLDSCQRAMTCAPDLLSRSLAMVSLGHVHLLRDEPDRAMPVLAQAVEQFDRLRLRQTQGQGLITLGEAQYLAGDLEQAERTVVQGQAICREAQKPYGEGHAQRVLSQIALRRNELVAAAQHLCHARRLFSGMQARYELARVYLLLAELGDRQNQPEIYTPALLEAHALFRQMQVPKYVVQAQALANRLGLSLP